MSQSERIYRHLAKGQGLTPIIALKRFQCFRLAARIADLRREGHDIKTRTVHKGGKSFASYWLV